MLNLGVPANLSTGAGRLVMKRILLLIGVAIILLLFLSVESASAQNTGTIVNNDHPRVFITDSQSWEVSGGGGGNWAAFGQAASGGARPQTAEIVKTFGERCPDVITNNLHAKADYVVVLDHDDVALPATK